MPEIIDILTVPFSLVHRFTVNNAVDYVTATEPDPLHATNYLVNAAGLNVFQAGDSPEIVSFGIVMPEAFTMWRKSGTNDILDSLYLIPYGKTSGDAYASGGWPGGVNYLQMQNFENVANIFIDCANVFSIVHPANNLLTENFRLKCFLSNLSNVLVSMKGVPDALNGKVFYIGIFVKVLHTMQLIV